MTTIAQFLREGMRNQHNMYDQAVGQLTPDQLHWVARGTNANHIGFTLWHYVRTEDNVIQFILQDRKPTIWIDGNYFERFGLDRIAQGTGMTTDDAHALRLPAIDQWMEYQNAVWKATDDFLASVDDESLERVVQVKPLPEMAARQALSNIVLTHGHSHFGEICMLRVLQGLPSSNI
jgi:hypothetical protein